MGVYRIAVFASGEGSNFQALAEAADAGRLGKAEIALLVCDKPSAPVVGRAERLGIPAFLFKPKDYESREAYERLIVEQLEAHGVDLVVLAGYMRLLTPVIVEKFSGRLINIHPSLLPQISRERRDWTGFGIRRKSKRRDGSFCRRRDGHGADYRSGGDSDRIWRNAGVFCASGPCRGERTVSRGRILVCPRTGQAGRQTGYNRGMI